MNKLLRCKNGCTACSTYINDECALGFKHTMQFDFGDTVYFHVVKNGAIQLDSLVITRLELWEGNLYVGNDQRLIDANHVKKIDKKY